MKIALLSFHNAINYGAALQGYALEKFLESLNYDCEYIDYDNESRKHRYDIWFLFRRCVSKRKWMDAMKIFAGSLFFYVRKKKFERFYTQQVKYSGEKYDTSESLKELNEKYDVFIVGSDQVWNPKHNGGDLNYLLKFVDDKSKTMSYSSSFGLTAIPENFRNGYSECLKSIRFLSTRENEGVKIIKQLVGRDVKLVLDPVFLITRMQWMELIGSKTMNESFVFSYSNRNGQMERFFSVTQYPMKGKKHYKLSRQTSLKDFINPSVRVKFSMSPLEFLSCIYNAELIVSASFHCISFAIILNKPFVCILSGDGDRDERLKTLLFHFGLEDRIFNSGMTAHDVSKKIDFSKLNRSLEEKRRESIDFLISSIRAIDK